MGTTLTGTTPANTYDSLIKVTDNGPLSGTAKYLSDGLGNDSVLALSTARVGIGTTTPVSALTVVGTTTSGITIQSSDAASNGLKIFNDSTTDTASIVNHYSGPLVFGTANTERLRIDSAGNIGIGTSSPQRTVHVNVGSAATSAVRISNSATGTGANDGFEVAIDSVGNAYVAQKENLPLVFLTNDTESMRITSTGNVGIGTSSPVEILHILGNQRISAVSGYSQPAILDLHGNNSNTYGGTNVSRSRIASYTEGGPYNASMRFYTNDSANALQERMRIDGTGNVGIGTTSPLSKLHIQGSIAGATPAALLRVGNNGTGYTARMILTDETTVDGNIVLQGSPSGASAQYIGFGLGSNLDTLKLTGDSYLRMASGTGGIQFNGDTAAANALDDYEEGTWTPSLQIGGQTTGITYAIQSGRYTKIGRQVSANCYIVLSSKGTNTGTARLYGLPFTIPNSNDAYSPAAFYNDGNIIYTGQFQAYGNKNSTSIVLAYATEAGTAGNLTDLNLANNSAWMLSITYTI